MFSQLWFWMYVIGIAMTKSNVYYSKKYENNKMVQYSSTVLFIALFIFVIIVTLLSIHWWWGPLMWLCGWVAQGIQVIIRNPIRMISAMRGSVAGNVLVRSIETILAPICAILAYLFFFFL